MKFKSGIQNRCSICNSVNSASIATSPEDLKQNITFVQRVFEDKNGNSHTDNICSDCNDELDIISHEHFIDDNDLDSMSIVSYT